MADDWSLIDLRRVVTDTKLWEFSTHLRRLLESDADLLEKEETIENVRLAFESLLAALKAVAARRKKVTLSELTAVQYQVHTRYAFWHLEQARSFLIAKGVDISKIPRELAPKFPASVAAPQTPRPPTPVKMDNPALPSSPSRERTLPKTPSETERMAVFTSEIALASHEDSVHAKDSVSNASTTSSTRRRQAEEEAKVRKEELERMNDLEEGHFIIFK